MFLNFNHLILVKNLVVMFDEDFNFRGQSKLVSQIHRNCVSKDDLEKLVHAFISCRMDDCTDLLTGLMNKTVRRREKTCCQVFALASS